MSASTQPDMAPARPHVAQGFNLVMSLEDKRQLPELLAWLKEPDNRRRLDEALESLHFVHYSRFVPIPEDGKLLIVTEFDGTQRDYVMDFAVKLDREFSKILSYMKGRPRLPVSEYPDEFYAYVDRNTVLPGQTEPPSMFRAYRDKTVLDIVGVGGAEKGKLSAPETRPLPPQAKLQANILRGYFSRRDDKPAFALHVGVAFTGDEAQSRAFVKSLLDGALRVTSAAAWDEAGRSGSDKPDYCLNLGFTHAGLMRLGVPALALKAFPAAFQQGAAEREVGPAVDAFGRPIARIDPSGNPNDWALGAPGQDLHAFVSIYSESEVLLEPAVAAIKERVGPGNDFGAEIRFEQRAATFDQTNHARVHFGYVDSISQPRIAGLDRGAPNGGQAESPAGEFILGAGQLNFRGSNFIGALPPGLADGGTYCAVRMIAQDEAAFRRLLDTAPRFGMSGEQLAAKLMGRRQDGLPLSRALPSCSGPANHQGSAGFEDDFLYAYPGDPERDDSLGQQCPFGSHIRRMNPRNARVVGIPELRRVIRRGLPYGPAFDEAPDQERGLFGLFFCGDLASQYEFLLRMWANGDTQTVGLRDTVDPIIGNPSTGERRFRLHRPDGTEVMLEVPALTRTVGSVYLFVPGMDGLAWLADAPWQAGQAEPAAQTPTRRTYTSRAMKTATADAPAPPDGDLSRFSPLDVAFRLDPYRFYAQMRDHSPLYVPSQRAWWVLRADDVREFSHPDNALFVKPGSKHRRGSGKLRAMPRTALDVTARFDDGLFFMRRDRHRSVRPALDRAFGAAIVRAADFAQQQAKALLVGPVRQGRIDIVADYAAPLCTRVFMDMMGIPRDHWEGLDAWVRAALNGHDEGAAPAMRMQGGTASLAMRGYFNALGMNGFEKTTAAGAVPLMGGIAALTNTGCPRRAQGPSETEKAPIRDDELSVTEATQTAVHFALGGYLSTEFLIATGVLNLLRHPDQLDALRGEPALMDRAIEEMLRYDAPFQMADRSVDAEDGCDITVAGKTVHLPMGTDITLVYGAANHDPSLCASNPDGFDILRDAPREHFGFGPPGERECIGAELARAVTKVALQTLLDNCPQLGKGTAFQPGEWIADPYFRSVKSLQVVLE